MKTLHFCLLLILNCAPLLGIAQKGLLQKEVNESGTLTFVRFKTDSIPKSFANAASVLKETLKLQSNDELRLSQSTADELGMSHQYYQQFYKGVKVAYSSYAIHGKGSVIETMNGNFHNVGDIDVNPKLTEANALQYALNHIGASVYKWQVETEEKWIKENFNDTYNPKGELVIVKDRLKSNAVYRLAWKFSIYAHQPLSRDYIYVDANTGEIVDKDSQLRFSNANGTSATRYSGTRNIVTDAFAGGFRLRELRNNVRIETYNMKNQGFNYGTAPDFVDSDNNWSALEFHNPNFDDAALDAHWGTEMVYDYWLTVHNRNSYDGIGSPLLGYVHADLHAIDPNHYAVSNNDGAFWDGYKMTYGDGSTHFKPVTALDVCAHEIAHGVSRKTINLSGYGEGGALDEGLSDIWGACVEQWARTNKQTWSLAEDIMNDGAPALRSLSNPKTGGDNFYSVTGGYPTTYKQQFWDSRPIASPHINGSVLGHWFYILSQGKSGTNELPNSYNVSGIGITKAAKITFRTESIVLKAQDNNPQNITYSQFRTATITAARDLYCDNSAEVKAVTDAWYAVGVGAAYTGTVPSLVGTEPICTTKTFTVQNPIAGTTTVWTTSNTSGLSVSAAGLATRVNSFNGSVNLNATLTGQSGCSSIVTKTVQVGAFNSGQITVSGTTGVCQGNWYTYTANFPGGHKPGYTYQWSKPANWGLENQSNNFITLSVPTYATPDYGTLRVSVFNTCATSPYCGITVYPGAGCYGGYSFSVSPNPATDLLTVALIENENSESNNATTATASKSSIEEYTVELSTEYGQKIISQTSIDGIVNINTQSLRKGLYILKIFSNEEVITKRILIN